MQVTGIKRTLLFGDLGNITMTARVAEGEDPLTALAELERLMAKGAENYERKEEIRKMISGGSNG